MTDTVVTDTASTRAEVCAVACADFDNGFVGARDGAESSGRALPACGRCPSRGNEGVTQQLRE